MIDEACVVLTISLQQRLSPTEE
uniref:Uncharacterized protein n=1 Tax=Rhizophora mucronata TaxID=61149 RepID=A0A2P2NGH3_RHIMU